MLVSALSTDKTMAKIIQNLGNKVAMLDLLTTIKKNTMCDLCRHLNKKIRTFKLGHIYSLQLIALPGSHPNEELKYGCNNLSNQSPERI